ncbi:MAG: hypothetical protein KME40_15085 [Komarekiella atlantica HA4396-MV6]|jgi:hypothetical protein|nr:hypothetical protein [Komarekiella atlantica HA4396-MV6]
MSSLISNSIGILPTGALGVSFFYNLTKQLTQIDDHVYFIERRGSASASSLKQGGKIAIATPQEIQFIPTDTILKPDLLTCYRLGFLPEVVLVCPNPDQLLNVITTLVELLVLIEEQEKLLQPATSFPLFVFCSNGIYFQRFRQIFIEKIEEATLFGRLPDLWPSTMPQIVCRFLRGVTIQTGLREGSGSETIYRPGTSRGRTQIAGGDANTRERCCQILAERGGWFEEAPSSSATRLEFDKALVNLVCNLLGQIWAIDSGGNFRALTVKDILESSHEIRMRELVYQVFRVGQMVKVYDLQEDFEVIFTQVIETCREHAEHIPSSLQWLDLNLRLGTLKPQMTPTEAWLIEPLIRYAKASGLKDAANYFQKLKAELVEKLTLAKDRNS